ncbi:integrin alpha-4-like isoform X2 [Oculina patagonica]
MKNKVLTAGLIYLFILTLGKVSGFNLDIKSAVLYEGPVQSDLFGYTVATHSYNGRKWLLVGAPLSNVTSSFGGETLVKYGSVFKCEYRPDSKSCTEIPVDTHPPFREQHRLGNETVIVEVEKKTEQWLGATLHSTGENGHVLTCAPRYSYAPFTAREGIIDHRYMSLIGQCFLIRQDLNGPQGPAVSPCEGQVGYLKGYCQAGISAEYTSNGEDVLMGTVGVKHFRGGLVSYDIFEQITTFSPNVSVGRGDYMGYSVSSGHFLSQKSTEIVGGGPRGNGLQGKVLMYSMDENSVIQVTSEVPPPPGITIGSYFGSSLCVVDLNNDMFSDLLVGAPRALNRDEGRVFVYVNNKNGALNLQDPLGLMGDNIPYAQFGRAIVRVGDLNKDGFQDVAIGAPFEENGAVYVYHGSKDGINPTYKQKLAGSSVDPGLRLFGYSVAGDVDMDGNGYPDIAVGAYGSNKAVLFRTRSIVNVEGKIELSRNQIVVESNDSLCRLDGGYYHKCLNLSVCFTNKDRGIASYTGLGLSYTVDLDRVKIVSGTDSFRRMFFIDDKTKEKVFLINGVYNLTKRGESLCAPPRTVYLKGKDNLGDVASSLSFDLDFGLVKSCGRDLCPVLNDSLHTEYTAKAFFIKRCKNRKICVPDLAVDGDVVLVGYDRNRMFDRNLRIGLVKELILQLTVSNKAIDYAYYSKISVKYPRSLGYQGASDDCEHDHSSDNDTQSQLTITCDVGRTALPGLSKKIFSLKFSAASVEEDFSILVKAESQAADANEADNSKEFFIAVKYEADLVIRGSSKPDQVIYSGAVKEREKIEEFQEEIGPQIVQTIMVSNYGPSVVEWSQVTITVPNLLKKDEPDSFLMYLLQVEVVGSGSCNAVVNHLNIKSASTNNSIIIQNTKRERRDVTRLGCGEVGCQSFQCRLGRLRQGDKVEIKLTSRLWQNTLLKLGKPAIVELETIAQVQPPSKVMQPDEENDVATIILTAKPARTGGVGKSIPWWVYLVSVLGGIILLAAAVLILYKLGFFKRKKESLEATAEEAAPMNKV